MFFSESIFISGMLKLDNNSHGFDVNSLLIGINDSLNLGVVPSFNLDLEVIKFQSPFASDSKAVNVPDILQFLDEEVDSESSFTIKCVNSNLSVVVDFEGDFDNIIFSIFFELSNGSGNINVD